MSFRYNKSEKEKRKQRERLLLKARDARKAERVRQGLPPAPPRPRGRWNKFLAKLD